MTMRAGPGLKRGGSLPQQKKRTAFGTVLFEKEIPAFAGMT
jgi:hypothetical protein